ncbi:hypothetical protein SOVF_077170, partial [Spinacia oleracea]
DYFQSLLSLKLNVVPEVLS